MLKRSLWIYFMVGIFLLTATAALAMDKKSAVLDATPDKGASFLKSLTAKPADLPAKPAIDETKIKAAQKLAASLSDSQRQLLGRELGSLASKTRALKKQQNNASLPSANEIAGLKAEANKIEAAAYKILNGEQLDLFEQSRPQPLASPDLASAPKGGDVKNPESATTYAYYSLYYNYWSQYYVYYGYLYAYYAYLSASGTVDNLSTYNAYIDLYYAKNYAYYAYYYAYYDYYGSSDLSYYAYYYAYYALPASMNGSALSALNYLNNGTGASAGYYSYYSWYYGGYLGFDYYTYLGYLYAFYHYYYE